MPGFACGWLAALVLLAPAVTIAAPLPVKEARELVENKSFDEIYLAWSSLKPGQHPEGDGPVAQLLLAAARQALEADDPSLALGLSDTARRLDPKSVEACLVNADAAVALDQREAAEAALDRALELAPRSWEVVFRRADYAAQEGQTEAAVKLFRRIPKSHALYGQAAQRAGELDAALAEERSNLAQLARAEAEQKVKQKAAARTAGTGGSGPPPVPARGNSSGAEDAFAPPAGLAARTSANFRIMYQGGARDFASRAQYEQRVLDMFEKSHAQVRSLIGRATTQPTDVVLYTEEEFRFHFGSMFGGGVLGFYSGKIRMNRAENLDHGFYATAVHEYVHAVVDAVASGSGDDVPRWLNEGFARWVERRVAGGDFINRGELMELQTLKARKQLPPLAQLDQAFGGQLVGVAYAKSSAVVEALASTGGLSGIVRVIEAIGRGQPFEKAFAYEFGDTRLSRLDAEVDKLLDR